MTPLQPISPSLSSRCCSIPKLLPFNFLFSYSLPTLLLYISFFYPSTVSLNSSIPACPILSPLGSALPSFTDHSALSFSSASSNIHLPSFLPASALFYESAPNGRDCFYLEADEKDEMVGSYETFYGDDSLRVTLELVDESASQNTRQLFHSLKEADTLKVAVPQKGKYALCLRNLLSNEQTVTFNIRVQAASLMTHPQDLATADQTETLRDLASQMAGKIEDISAQQGHAITRGEVYRTTSESTNSRVLWWTVFQVVSLCVMSVLQVSYMRSFFEVKTIV
eukprot:GHVQ01015161.1.p1 GENE.GHVQ01015161.1~~GHVQ01015161.1.p1  ORF type:complete len:281 (+),score=59.40 GHVQ01015161.1:231-1073(+)